MVRNYALKNIKTDFIAILDADDICERTRIEKQVAFFDNNKHIKILGSNCTVKNNYYSYYLKLPKTNKDITNNIFKLNPFILSSVMITHNAWIKLDGFHKTEYGNSDLDMWFRAVENNIDMYNLQV